MKLKTILAMATMALASTQAIALPSSAVDATCKSYAHKEVSTAIYAKSHGETREAHLESFGIRNSVESNQSLRVRTINYVYREKNYQDDFVAKKIELKIYKYCLNTL